MPSATQTRSAQREMTVKRDSVETQSADMTQEISAEDVRLEIEARLKSALEEAMSKARQEVAEPYPWWNLYAIGPIQPGARMAGSFAGPLLPHQVIRVNEQAYVATILLLNPFYPVPSAAELISTFALPYEVNYTTGNLTLWAPGPAELQHTGSGSFIPGLPFAIDVFTFRAQTEGLYEMNISARIYGCGQTGAPPFSGFARAVVDVDPDLFMFSAPGMQVDQPIRFQVYR